MGCADLLQRAIFHDQVVIAAQWGICHYRHIVLCAPGQEVTLDAAVVETVGDLIGCAVVAVRNAEQIFHLPGFEVGYTPSVNLSRRA